MSLSRGEIAKGKREKVMESERKMVGGEEEEIPKGKFSIFQRVDFLKLTSFSPRNYGNAMG